MPRPRNAIPTYRLHRQSGQAVVSVPTRDGRRREITLGIYNSPDSIKEYQRIIGELRAGFSPTTKATSPESITVAELILAYMRFAKDHYRSPDGKETSEFRNMADALRVVLRLYSHTRACDYGPLALKSCRRAMIDDDLSRKYVNARINRIRRVFKWAASEELIPFDVYNRLTTVTGLSRGRTAARENEPIMPVPDAVLSATLPHLTPMVRAMVEVQRLTGMRPAEVCKLRLSWLDRSGPVWTYRLDEHKTSYRGREKSVPIGPKAQAILLPFIELAKEVDYLFSPRMGMELRWKTMRANRKTKVQPSQVDRKKIVKRQREWSDFYRVDAYKTAIVQSIERANKKLKPAEQIPHWTPNQLRHTFATVVRAQFGLEAAQVLLGHSQANVTQIYAERDYKLAEKVAGEVG